MNKTDWQGFYHLVRCLTGVHPLCQTLPHDRCEARRREPRSGGTGTHPPRHRRNPRTDQTSAPVYLESRPLLKSDQQPQEIHAGLQKGRRNDQTHRSRATPSSPPYLCPTKLASDDENVTKLEHAFKTSNSRRIMQVRLLALLYFTAALLTTFHPSGSPVARPRDSSLPSHPRSRSLATGQVINPDTPSGDPTGCVCCA